MTFASDVDAAEKGTEACTPPSNQRGLAPEPRQCRTSVGTSQSRGVLGDGESVQTNAQKIDFDEFEKNYCRASIREYDNASSEWQKLAAMPGVFHNTDIIRNFKPVGLRAIQYTGGRLSFLQTVLDELDATEIDHSTLTSHQTRLPGQPHAIEYRDMVLEETTKVYLTYVELVRGYRDVDKLHAVPYRRWKHVTKFMLGNANLSVDSLLGVRAPNEAVSFTTSSPRLMLWLADTQLGILVTRAVERYFGSINLEAVVGVHRGFTILYAFALLIPIGVIFLGELTKVQSFSVVVTFTVLFCLQVGVGDRHRTLITVCAYGAVLVTVMVQLDGGAAPVMNG